MAISLAVELALNLLPPVSICQHDESASGKTIGYLRIGNGSSIKHRKVIESENARKRILHNYSISTFLKGH